jgi:hypothetical protein
MREELNDPNGFIAGQVENLAGVFIEPICFIAAVENGCQ